MPRARGRGRLDDDALLLAMARHVLGGPQDSGRSSYQISLDLCPRCGRGAQLAAGEFVPVDAAIVDMATCDAQHLGERQPEVRAPRAANENAETRSRGVTGEVPGKENGNGGSPDRPVHQCSNHAHVGAQDRRENDATIPAVVATSATRATAPTLDDLRRRAPSTPSPRSSPRCASSAFARVK